MGWGDAGPAIAAPSVADADRKIDLVTTAEELGWLYGSSVEEQRAGTDAERRSDLEKTAEEVLSVLNSGIEEQLVEELRRAGEVCGDAERLLPNDKTERM
jgi:hypothetical protein